MKKHQTFASKPLVSPGHRWSVIDVQERVSPNHLLFLCIRTRQLKYICLLYYEYDNDLEIITRFTYALGQRVVHKPVYL
jgi:hypothetical protein